MVVSFRLAWCVVLVVLGLFGVGGYAAGNSSSEVGKLLTELPECALLCIAKAVSTHGDCSLTDVSCLCESEEITAATRTCLLATCSIEEALTTQRLQSSTCGIRPRDKSGLVRRVQWSGWGLACAAVAFRFLARLRVLKGVGVSWDDWSILACVAICLGSQIILTIMVNDGLGKDVWMLDPDMITGVLFYYWVSAFLYVTIIFGIKISILLLYLRLFPTDVSKWFGKTCYAMMGLSVAATVALSLSEAFACSPVDYYWLRWNGKHKGQCINTIAQIYSAAGINILFDLAIFLLPLPLLVPLKISMQKKIGVCAVFMVGLFATACSIIRLQYLVHWGLSQNPTYDYTSVAIWSSVEANLGIICACMPPMARPIKYMYKKARCMIEGVSFRSDASTITSGLPSMKSEVRVAMDTKIVFEERPYERQSRSLDEVELGERVSERASPGLWTQYPMKTMG